MNRNINGAIIWAIRVALMAGSIALGRWALQAMGWRQPHFFASCALGFGLYFSLRLMAAGQHRGGLRRQYDARLRHER